MPWAPKRHGEERREQRRREYDRARQEDHAFYCSPAWLAIRKAVLERDHYLCQECLRQGKTVAGSKMAVDHIKSRRERPDLALDMDNLETLCPPCHNRKTVTRDHGFGR